MNTSPQMRKIQRDLVAIALDIARDNDIELDLTEKSIGQVDRLLQELHEAYKHQNEKTPESEAAMYGIALEMAAYIIEVIEHVHGQGTWKRDSEIAGEET